MPNRATTLALISSSLKMYGMCRPHVTIDKAWVKVLTDDLQQDSAARANVRVYSGKILAAIKQVASFAGQALILRL